MWCRQQQRKCFQGAPKSKKKSITMIICWKVLVCQTVPNFGQAQGNNMFLWIGDTRDCGLINSFILLGNSSLCPQLVLFWRSRPLWRPCWRSGPFRVKTNKSVSLPRIPQILPSMDGGRVKLSEVGWETTVCFSVPSFFKFCFSDRYEENPTLKIMFEAETTVNVHSSTHFYWREAEKHVPDVN